MRTLLIALGIVILSACATVHSQPVSAPHDPTPSPPPAATEAVYFTAAAGLDASALASKAMGRPVFLERAPGPGMVPAGTSAADVTPVYVVPVEPGGESAALERFLATAGVRTATLGPYPPRQPS